jgi:hypothetical protein
MTTRITAIALLALPALAIGACSKGAGNNSVTNVSTTSTTTTNSSAPATAGGAPANGDAVRMQPGLWEVSVEAEGLPGQAPGPHTVQNCVTPEQADQAAAQMMNGGGAPGMTCDRSGVTMAGGRVSGTANCSGANGMSVTSTVDGELTSTSIDIRQQSRISVSGQTQNLNAHITGHRVGECPAGGANANASGAAPATKDND